jgi:tRNA threonylcarbamoyladenosine biosynthesis protein TsaE
MEVITKSASETQKFARKVADTVVAHRAQKEHRNGRVIALSGDLGAGKTTFVQGFAQALGIDKRITSPTFILMRQYPITPNGMLYHMDAYRIDANPKEEVENLGLREIWDEQGNILLIEWAEKIKEYLPKDTIWIHFEYVDEDIRKIIVN